MLCRNHFTETQNLETLIRSKYNILIRAHVNLTYDLLLIYMLPPLLEPYK